MRVLGGRQTLLKEVASALLSKLLGDVAAPVDEDVRHIASNVLVADDDEIPGITSIRMCTRGCECHGVTQGITEDDERLTCLQRVDDLEGGAWSTPSVHVARVAPDGTGMIM